MAFSKKNVFSLLAPLFLFTAVQVSAQTVVTTNAGDESNGSLGWAVTTLNNAGAGAISIENVGLITLTQPLPSVSQTVTFLGTSFNIIGQDTAQSQLLFQQAFTLGPSASLNFHNNGVLSSGLDAATTASSLGISSNAFFGIYGGDGGPQTNGGGAFATWGTASASSSSGFVIQGGSGGVSSIAGNGGAAAVTTGSLTLSGAHGFIVGGGGGDSNYQNGNGGSATLSLGSLNLDTAAQLDLTAGSGGVSTGGLGSGGNAVLAAISVSMTGTNTQLYLTGGAGGGPTAIITEAGPANAGDGGSVLFSSSSVTVDSQANINIYGGPGGTLVPGSFGHGGAGGAVTAFLGSLNLTNGGFMGVTAGAGGQGAKGWFGGAALVTVGSLTEGTNSTLSIVSGAGGGSLDGGSLNFTMASQTLASGATFIAQGGAGGSGAVNGGNGGAVQVGGQVLTLSSGSLWEVLGGAGGTGTSTNGTGSAVFVSLYDLEGSGTVSLGGPGTQTLQLTTGDFSGVLAGTEGLDVVGYGVVTLTGANTYSGGTTLSTGILIVNSDSNLGTGNLTLDAGTLETGNFATSKAVSLTANGGTIVATPGNAVTFNGVISGPGGLVLTAGGTFDLNASNTYTGLTNLIDGTLDLSGQVVGPVAVSGGSSLIGTGTISGAVTNNGTLQAGDGGPGSSMTVGNFIQNGSYTQGSNGNFNAIVSPSTSNYLFVYGDVNLAGSLSVSQTVGTYNGISFRYSIVDCWNGKLTGTFTAINNSLMANWGSSVLYDFDNATLALYRTDADFTPWATGANQFAAAQALNAAVSTGNADMAAKLNEIYAMPSGQGMVLGQLKSDIYTALPGILLDNLQFEDNRLFDRLDGTSSAGTGAAHAQLVRNILSAEVSGPAAKAAGLSDTGFRGLWVENTDSAGTVNGDSNLEGFNQSNYGFLAGFDTELFDGFTSGLMGGWVHTDVTGNSWGEKVAVDSADFAAYGGKKFGSFQLDGVAGVCVDHFTSNRSVSIGSDINPLSAVYEGSRFQGALQGAYAFDLSGFTVKPLVGAQYGHFSENRFTESNSDSLGLSVPALNTDSLRPYLGLESTRYFTLDQDLGLIPRVNLSVSQDLMNSAVSYQEFFLGAKDNPFTMTGITPSATMISVEAGTQVVFGKQINLFANYQGHFSGTQGLNTFNGGLDISF